MRLLLVEDDAMIGTGIQQGLRQDGFTVDWVRDGVAAELALDTEPYDLLVLDLGLPKKPGLEVLRNLRRKGNKTPVLVLTARDAVSDRVTGLDAGADDYLVKPFAFPELHARIRTLLRRGRSDQVLRLKVADLEMDLVTRAVVRASTVLELTAKEFEVLEFLMRHAGQVIPRDMLAREIWGDAARVVPLDNVIDVHMARLRRKLDAPFDRSLLHTIRGVGFVLREEN